MTILIVDGDADSRERLRVILAEAAQWNIGAVCTGAEALRVLESGEIDLVLTDLMAPEMEGLALCREIKARSDLSHLPVVMMLDNGEHEYLDLACEAGACDYILKPVEPLDVLARVRAVLRIKKDTDSRLQRERSLTAANRRLLQLSVVDAVTGIANRRGFDQTLDRVWRSASRQRVDVALLMIDVDFFKPYNDQLGHLAGDQCLRSIAEALSQGLKRPDDFLARYGGEEFSVVLPRTDAGGRGGGGGKTAVRYRESRHRSSGFAGRGSHHDQPRRGLHAAEARSCAIDSGRHGRRGALRGERIRAQPELYAE